MTATAARPGVPGWMHWLSGLQAGHPRAAIALGRLESRLLRAQIEPVPLRAPVYIAGLARSGTTLLLELLARHRELGSHLYRDFPPVTAPAAWNWFVDRAARGPGPAAERAHADGIVVTAESPEAFEEVLWMAFFPGLHGADGPDAVLTRETRLPEFEAFYRDHVRKLLRVRGRARYVCKANYHVTRLPWLHRCFADARFIVPLRDPVWHIASLMKQHALFCADHARDPRTRAHMARSGHFEFGLDRRPIAIGGTAAVQPIAALWQQGSRAAEIEGWARYWTLVHDHLASVLEADAVLRGATLVLRYETLCADPAGSLQTVLAHAALAPDAKLLAHAAATVKAPDYYRPAFSPDERALIERHTRSAQQRLARWAAPIAEAPAPAPMRESLA